MIYLNDVAKEAAYMIDETGAISVNIMIGDTHVRLSPVAAVALARSLHNVGSNIVTAIGDAGFAILAKK